MYPDIFSGSIKIRLKLRYCFLIYLGDVKRSSYFEMMLRSFIGRLLRSPFLWVLFPTDELRYVRTAGTWGRRSLVPRLGGSEHNKKILDLVVWKEGELGKVTMAQWLTAGLAITRL